MHLILIPIIVIVIAVIGFSAGDMIRGFDFSLPGFGFPDLSLNNRPQSKPEASDKQPILQAPPKETVANPQTTVSTPPPFALETIITTPAQGTVLEETNKVTFEFEGYITEGTAEGSISFETLLDGVDADWQHTSKSSRVVELPLGSNGYTLFVRATIGDVHDFTPATKTVFVNVSPFFKKLGIANFQATNSSGSKPFKITLKPKLEKEETIDITGWRMLSRFRGAFSFPQGTEKISSTIQTQNTGNIIVRNKDAIYIRGETGPFGTGINFRTNICFGYLKPFFPSIPRTPSCSQEKPTLKEISHLHPECQEFILKDINFSACEIPDTSQEVVLINNSQCRSFVSSTINGFNYAACYRKNSEKSNFTENRWYIYTDREFGHPLHDTITLYDSEDLFVDQYLY